MKLRHVFVLADLEHAQRAVEPKNADSHLAFIAGGLHSCVSYDARRAMPVPFSTVTLICAGGTVSFFGTAAFGLVSDSSRAIAR